MTLISSRSNPKIKLARALRQKKARQESGLFIVEGIRPVGEAVQAGATIDTILYAPELLKSEFASDLIQAQSQAGVACHPTSAEVFGALADKENPQGLLALVRQPEWNLADLNPQNFPWGVALVSLFWHPVVTAPFADFAAWSRGHGYHIYGTSAHAAVDYHETPTYAWPRILLLGSEREGLTQEQAQICDLMIRLPMRGRATSLNLGVAAGVMLYAMLER
jgi:TrmH family RNA methyltransferase